MPVTLKELADVADRADAAVKISLDRSSFARPRYCVEFESRQGGGAIYALDEDIDTAARKAIDHIKTYTRPDGGVDWVPPRAPSSYVSDSVSAPAQSLGDGLCDTSRSERLEAMEPFKAKKP